MSLRKEMVSEKVVKALEEQLRMIGGLISEERHLTVKDYRDYLKSTDGRSIEV